MTAKRTLIDAMVRGVEARRAEMDLEPWRSQAEIDRELMRAALRSILDHGPTQRMLRAASTEVFRCARLNYGGTPSAEDLYSAMLAAELEDRQ